MPVENCPKRPGDNMGWDGLWTEDPMDVGIATGVSGASVIDHAATAETAGGPA